MQYKQIDGSQGEGGGQILRTAITLAVLTQQNIELVNIRSGRKKPGLLRQHLTAVLAAQQICHGTTEGAELGSTRLRFSPGKVTAGNYHFAIGSAGSTVLVCQTILPILALADGPSTITFEGGTHNGMSPSLSFLQQAYLPILEAMGVECQVDITRLGFYPAGGGKWQLTIAPATKLQPFDLTANGGAFAKQPDNCKVTALISNLPVNIAEREVITVKKRLNWFDAKQHIEQLDGPGPGNSVILTIATDDYHNVFEVVGEHRVTAERVAKKACGQLNKFVYSEAAVEAHLADQLLLWMVLAGKGRFTTTKPSPHTLTNIAVIDQMTGMKIHCEQLTELRWQVDC